MAGSLNKVMLIGNLGKDPEMHNTKSGDKIANMTLATGESWTNKETGKKEERTEWHRVVVFNPGLAEVVEKYAKKGDKILVEGKLVTRKWEDKDGVEKYTTEVVIDRVNGGITFLTPKGSNSNTDHMDEGEKTSEVKSSQSKVATRGSMVTKPTLTKAVPVAASVSEDDEIPF
jgi:single-strand DNA-binding protein